MFNLFLIFQRIISPIGEAKHLNFYTADNFTQYLRETEYCIVFFGSAFTNYDFANFAISQYKHKISFARASLDIGKKYGCQNSRCILPFKNQKLLKSEYPPFNPIGFSKWVNEIASLPIIHIGDPGTLEKLFETPGSHVFGIEFPTRPNWLDEGRPFYNVNLEVIRYFNLNLNSGLYIYRSADRQIIPASNNYKSYLRSPLVDYRIDAWN